MLTLKKLALTGGLSCGKSSVCRIFKELSAYVVSADIIVHQLLTPETSVGRQVIQFIGTDSVKQGQLERSNIANKVFSNPDLLKSLEQILHPAVFEQIEWHYKIAQQDKEATLFLAELPLLFESHLFDSKKGSFDRIIAVVANLETCQKRFTQSGQYNAQQFEQRMKRQLDNQEKAKRADFVIYNNGSLEELRQAVLVIYHKLFP